MRILKVVGLVLILIIISLGGGFCLGRLDKIELWRNKDNGLYDKQSFTNQSLNFSLKYPENWLKTERFTSNKDVIFSMEFKDPKREKELEISDCLINESVGWANGIPARQDCTNILAKVTDQQRKTLNVKIYSRNIYVNVIQPDKEVTDLRQWLIDRYRTPDGELQAFEPSGNITVAGQQGYIISIGCCANYDVAYVVQKGQLIYQLGTNYGDGQLKNGQNSLLDEMISDFKFIKTSASLPYSSF